MVSAYPWHRLEGISSKAASYFLNKATMSTLEQKALWKICQSGSILNFHDIFLKLFWDNPGGVQCRLSVLIQLIDLSGGDSKYLHIVGVMGLRQLKRTFSSRYTHYIYSSGFTACVICSCLCSSVQQNQPNSWKVAIFAVQVYLHLQYHALPQWTHNCYHYGFFRFSHEKHLVRVKRSKAT